MKTKLTTEQIERLYNLGLNVINLDEMLAVLPKKITDRQKVYSLKLRVDHFSDNWDIWYENELEYSDTLDSFQSADELVDAIYEMVCWLKGEENLKWL